MMLGNSIEGYLKTVSKLHKPKQMSAKKKLNSFKVEKTRSNWKLRKTSDHLINLSQTKCLPLKSSKIKEKSENNLSMITSKRTQSEGIP